MKRILAALLCLALVVGVFAGCGGSSKTNIKKGDGSTLTIGISSNALVEDYDNNALTKWLEETSGYNIEFQFFSSNGNECKTQLSTMMAGGEKLPDILWGIELGSDIYTEYGQDGYFVDLKDYYADKQGKAKVFWDQFNKLPELDKEKYLKTLYNVETGAAYALPTLQTSEIDTMAYTMYLNKTWMDKLGLAMPTNNEELYNVLVAFRDKDPNGNGKKDEIPLLGCSSLGGDAISYFINQFCYFDKNHPFNLGDDGKLYASFTTNEYREGLKYANKLMNEQLLSSLSITCTNTDMKAYVCPVLDADGKMDPSSQLVGGFCGHLTLMMENDHPAMYDYAPISYWNYAVLNDNIYHWNTYITEDCENVDAAWDLCMTMFTEEGGMRMRYGEKEVDWTKADANTKSYIGMDAEIKLINNVFSTQSSQMWNQVACSVVINAENEVTQVEDMSEWFTYRNKVFGEQHDNYWAAVEKYNPTKVPSYSYTEQEKLDLEMIKSNCSTYMGNSRTQFVSGTIDPNSDADWNTYLKNFEDMGLATWLATSQTAMERSVKN